MRRLLRFVPIVTLVIITLVFFWKLAFTDLILARGDTISYFYPYWDARNAAMRVGDLPLWSPDIFTGVPLLANPQLGTYYPPNWLTIPFAAPYAIRLSIIIHAIWAGLGTMALYWVALNKKAMPALLAGILFACGGYIAAHVEQINQLQGVSWMPWLFLFYHQMQNSSRPVRCGILLAIGFAMQLFSGHTQTVFITGFGLGIYAIRLGLFDTHKIQRVALNLLPLACASVLGALLAIPQLLPTLELTGMSNRGGGFTAAEATAFSLNPTHIGRYLLPSYDTQLLGEAVATIGIIGLGLAIAGIILSDNKKRWLWVTIAVIGLLFAFGRYNPLYWVLASLPGFNLFRVPPRWLSLFALAIALLAGHGLETIVTEMRRRVFAVGSAVVVVTVLVLLAYFVPISESIIGSATATRSTILIWGITAVIFVALMLMKQHLPQMAVHSVIIGAIIIELFFAMRSMPYNDPVAPDVYEAQRFTISQMLAYADDDPAAPRFLSISALGFDTGDRATLRQRYERLSMDEQAIQVAFTGVKGAEVIAPNLPLTWGIASLDGYGGGVLPTTYYTQFTSLLLPEGANRDPDGRIGETLALSACRGACIPPFDVLRLTDTRYLITDKVFDIVQDGIRFDTTFAGHWFEDLSPRPDFEFDEVQVLHNAPLVSVNGAIDVQMDDTLQLTSMAWDDLTSLSFGEQESIVAVTVVDNRTSDFLELQPARWARVLSSDIKLYAMQNTAVDRASITSSVTILPDDWDGHEAALDILRENPNAIIVHGDADPLPQITSPFGGGTEIISYSDTRVDVRVNATHEAYVMLKDAYYPRWRASIDGNELPVYRANVLFRAVRVPVGEHVVTFEFVPTLWFQALWVGAVLWMIVLVGLLVALRRTSA